MQTIDKSKLILAAYKHGIVMKQDLQTLIATHCKRCTQCHELRNKQDDYYFATHKTCKYCVDSNRKANKYKGEYVC